MGRSALPCWSLERESDRHGGHGERQERQECPFPVAGHDPDGQRHTHEGEAVEQTGSSPSEAHGQCLLAGLGVRRDVPQVVRLEQRSSQQAHRHPDPEDEPPVVLVVEQVPGHADNEGGMLDVGRPRGGNEAEKDEDEEFAEAEIPVRPRAARVRPARDAADETDRDQPPRDAGRQSETGQSGDAEGDRARRP